MKTKQAIPKTYENFGDIDWKKYGGIFTKQFNENTFHVITFSDMGNIVELEAGQEWFKVNDGYVDITEWNRNEELSHHGFENEEDVSNAKLATIIFENRGAIEFGDDRNFESENEALECLHSLFK